jgi:ABC-type Mn2+/Zn2+ transport system permease subunit
MAIGVACVIVGLTAARALDVAPGGTIVLVAAAVFGVTSLVGARR